MDVKVILSWFWELLKIAIIPFCIWLLERQIAKRDDRREKEYTERKKELDEQNKQNVDIQFLMMDRIDSLSELTQLMAKKLHDAGIINGDLEIMQNKYKGLNDEYEKTLKHLAREVLNKQPSGN